MDRDRDPAPVPPRRVRLGAERAREGPRRVPSGGRAGAGSPPGAPPGDGSPRRGPRPGRGNPGGTGGRRPVPPGRPDALRALPAMGTRPRRRRPRGAPPGGAGGDAKGAGAAPACPTEPAAAEAPLGRALPSAGDRGGAPRPERVDRPRLDHRPGPVPRRDASPDSSVPVPPAAVGTRRSEAGPQRRDDRGPRPLGGGGRGVPRRRDPPPSGGSPGAAGAARVLLGAARDRRDPRPASRRTGRARRA